MKWALPVSLLLVALTARGAEAQAWVRDPGGVYASLGYRLTAADRFYTNAGDVVPINDYRQHAIGIYAEVGVVERHLMATVRGDLLRRGVLVDQGAVTGVGDLSVGLFTGLLERPFRLTFGAELGIPTGDPAPDTQGDATAQTTADLLPTGDGEVDLALRLLGGHGFRWRRAQQFLQVDLGYLVRTSPRAVPDSIPRGGDIRDQVTLGAKTGLRIDRPGLDRLWWILRFRALVVVQDRGGGASGAVTRIAGLGDGVETVSLGLQILLDVAKGWGVAFSVDGPLHGRNVPAAPTAELALTFQRDPE